MPKRLIYFCYLLLVCLPVFSELILDAPEIVYEKNDYMHTFFYPDSEFMILDAYSKYLLMNVRDFSISKTIDTYEEKLISSTSNFDLLYWDGGDQAIFHFNDFRNDRYEIVEINLATMEVIRKKVLDRNYYFYKAVKINEKFYCLYNKFNTVESTSKAVLLDVFSNNEFVQFGVNFATSEFSVNNKYVVGIDYSSPSIARVYDVASGVNISEFNHIGNINSLNISSNGNNLVTASEDFRVRVYDLSQKKLIASIVHNSPVTSAYFSNDGETVFFTDATHNLYLAQAMSGKIIDMQNVMDAYKIINVVGNNLYLIDDSESNMIIWNSQEKTVVGKFIDLQPYSYTYSFALDSQNKRLIEIRGDRNSIEPWGMYFNFVKLYTRTWDLENNSILDYKKIAPLSDDDCFNSAVLSEDGNRIFLSCLNKKNAVYSTAFVFDLASSQIIDLKSSFITTDLAISQDNHYVSGSSRTGDLIVWDLEANNKLYTLFSSTNIFAYPSFSSDSKELIYANAVNRTVLIIDTATSMEKRKLNVKTTSNAYQSHVGFSPDMTLAHAAMDNGEIFLWDILSGIEFKRLQSNDKNIRKIVYSSDNNYIVSGAESGSVKIWNTFTGELLASFNAGGNINDIVITDDFRYIYTAAYDIQRWDISSITGVSVDSWQLY